MTAPTPFAAQELVDFLFAFPRGVDMGRAELLLPKNQVAYAENATVRGDFLSPRPPHYRRPLLFSATTALSANLTSAEVRQAFTGGQWQGACYFWPDTGSECLMEMVSGHLYRISMGSIPLTVDDVTPTKLVGGQTVFDANDQPHVQPQAWLWQSERWVIVEDGVNVPIIFDGSTGISRRCRQAGAVVGTIPVSPGKVPGVGSTRNVTLAAPFAADVGDMVALVDPNKKFLGYYRVQDYVASADTNNAEVSNLDGVLNIINPGDTVQRTYPKPTLTKFGFVEYFDGSGGHAEIAYGNNASYWKMPGKTGLSTGFPGQNGDSIYFDRAVVLSGQFLGPGQVIPRITTVDPTNSGCTLPDGSQVSNPTGPFTVTAGAGVPAINVGPLNRSPLQPATQFGYGILVGCNAYYIAQVPTSEVIGTVAVQKTLNAGASAVAIQLNAAYTGVDKFGDDGTGVIDPNNKITINGVAYSISKYTPTAVANQYTLYCVSLPTGVDTTTDIPAASTLQSLSELPIGRMGAYILGRNWICLADSRSYWASDLCGGSSGNQKYNYRDAVLKSTENDTLNGGGFFTVPGNDIRCIIGTAQLDTSLGQGPVGIGTPYAFFSNQAPFDRTEWAKLTTPLQTASVISNGPLGHKSTVAANGDTLYRALDGIRSMIMARRDINQWGNLPQSLELEPVLSADPVGLLIYGSAIVFDNRCLMTAAPSQSDRGVTHAKLAVLNFDLLSSLIQKQPSCYDGVWTGLDIFELVKGTFNGAERAFAFCLENNEIVLEELLTSSINTPDNDGTNDVPIVWEFESPVLAFGDVDPQTRQYKSLMNGEIWIDKMYTDCKFEVFYRPDQYPTWIPWLSWTENLTAGASPNFRPRMGLGQPSSSKMDPSTNRPLPDGYYYQVKVVVTGQCSFVGGKFMAMTKPEPRFAPINPNAS
jgi:hypothetical protein